MKDSCTEIGSHIERERGKETERQRLKKKEIERCRERQERERNNDDMEKKISPGKELEIKRRQR